MEITQLVTSNEKRLTEVESRAKSNTYRLDEVKKDLEHLEKRQDDLGELVGVVKVLAAREENLESDVKEIKSDVKSLTSKSGQRWDSMVEKIIFAIVGAIVAYFLARLGMQ